MMKPYFSYLLLLPSLLLSLTSCSHSNSITKNDLQVLVVRGGHFYDTPEFEEMCLGLHGVNSDLVLVDHFEKMTAEEIDQQYDAILFLDQNKKYTTTKRNRERYMNLAKRGVGMVFLHFTLSSQPEWDEYHDLIGGKWFLKKFEPNEALHSTYYTDLTVDLKILDRNHPATADLDDFTMTDAFYGNIYMHSSVHPLVGSDNPKLANALAWAHHYDRSKIIYIMPGFTRSAYENESYQKLISNSLNYVASRTE